MAYFDTLEANNRSDKGPSQNPFNYIKSTISGEHDRPTKIWKFKLDRVLKVKFRPEISVKHMVFFSKSC